MRALLPWARRAAAVAVLVLFGLGFAGLAAQQPWLGAVERVQAVPALLSAVRGGALGVALLAVLVLLTLVFGRVYCSWLCPLGMLQDVAHRAVHPRRPRKARFTPNHPWLRAAVALAVFGTLACGCIAPLQVFDPYSIAAREAGAAAEPGRYGLWALLLIAGSLALPLGMALWRGRLYCNTLCPVGAVLGLLARRAPLVPHIDRSACVRCAACMRSCKAHAIDLKQGRVDATRCIACYDCTAACTHGALRLRPLPKPQAAPSAEEQPDLGRRAVLGLGLFGLASAALPARAEELLPRAENAAPAAVPPGAGSVARLLDTCTACGLCISNCPTHVLRPSVMAFGLRGFMKPHLEYGTVACADDCNRCSSLCPEGALRPLSLAEKRRTRIGMVHYDKRTCIPWQSGYPCGHCAEACPTGALTLHRVQVPQLLPDACNGCRRCFRTCPHGAITMQEEGGRLLPVFDSNKCVGCGYCAEACRKRHAIRAVPLDVPQVNAARCIGCGACTAACPATPERAMTVTPLAVHAQAAER